ncbi:Deoxynucleoside triphosphate triphosphohydrolase SAMHD1 [Anabarilius grahami]|uniref:Deoxynucleoside triphosphate triphosphohydrolase SAMHD1 n=1 Tax=Anabarilius grahami TaxID=495550 RepID=A0A3N0XH11_ANAGA|nr:Deoxynucleoside triphosphate triphosphohydrolase SAMHD1 [Anabarilius grahami]
MVSYTPRRVHLTLWFLLCGLLCVFDVFKISSVFVSLLQHEQMSVLMFDDIVKTLKAENEDVLKEHGLDDRDVIFIKELIEGAKASAAEWTYKGRNEDKSFLYEIVANKQNGIDVDKWDYFAR